MRSNKNLQLKAVERQIYRAFGKRPPILVLGAVPDDAVVPKLAPMLREDTDRSIMTSPTMCHARDGLHSSMKAAGHAWTSLASQYNTGCLGLLVAAEAGVASALHVVSNSIPSGELPGAIALVGYEPGFGNVWHSLSTMEEIRATSMPGRTHCPPSGSALPPLAFFLPADHKSLAECARDCRKLRASGHQVHMEVIDPFRAGTADRITEASVTELVNELGAFFEAHLLPYFPKAF